MIIKRLPTMPVERALKVISGRWKALILYHLFECPRRLSELSRLVPGITQKVLIQQLREMEEHGLLHRKIHSEIPPRIYYAVTELGLSLEPVISSLCVWGRRHAAALDELDRIADCNFARSAKAAAHLEPERDEKTVGWHTSEVGSIN